MYTQYKHDTDNTKRIKSEWVACTDGQRGTQKDFHFANYLDAFTFAMAVSWIDYHKQTPLKVLLYPTRCRVYLSFVNPQQHEEITQLIDSLLRKPHKN